ncbi:MAG: hypothetical protein QOK40_3684 [Miltoncostaeaceae bacterium]|nr:hypothetical protein [Miltoncostaeaceae bacterium]
MNAPTRRRRVRALGFTLVASAALAVPAGALAQSAPATAPAIQAHANASQSALAQAVRMVAGPNDGQALRVFIRSRSELGKARAGANSIVKHAITPVARAKAAEALGIVATLESTNLPRLIGMIDDVVGPFQNAVAKATLVDTLARDRAVDVLQVLLAGVPAAAQDMISRTVATLMTGHTDEIAAGTGVLGQIDIPKAVKSILSTALGAGLHGQAGAAGGLKDIIGMLPQDVRNTLSSAFAMVKVEQEKAFGLLNDVLAGATLPAPVRSIVTGVMDTTRSLLDGLLSSLAPSQPVANTPSGSSGPPAPVVTVPGTGGVVSPLTGPTDLLSGILGAGSMPINLLNSILGSIPNPMTLVNGILGSMPNPATLVGGILGSMPNPTTLVNGILGGLTGATTAPAPGTGTGTPSLFPDPTQLLNALLPGGLNPFQLMSNILGGVPAAH